MSEFSRIDDHGDDRGLCKSCRFWDAEHDGAREEDATVGLCMHAELTHFSLQVSGHCGCNRYAAVLLAAAAGK
ncbi:hypothetical protein [Urbifossiella limnaea]|uniref:Uncharacterized protein n=1 Tax=Urbifossiella limnaea TaxID=2528023 RepID=A0A517XYS9_9BACT|nr:hypothetical protein [Urbifossiella limnaea]QDU22662.1 hypothetical protein ETAA1_46450 [Urbifossiella limnaea]